ncbi:MAG: M24 family metallopeptidase [Bifidobacteriaceae bacterium]|jgi:Xaa-Pro aminopeptidase|nr:M24 family metallopeptidase [Bifidobacteriaceae bacterium]
MNDKGRAELAEAPPEGLIRAQRMAIEVAEQACRAAEPGQSEKDLHAYVEGLVLERGGVGVWTPTVVGFGAGTLSCWPTDKPSDRPLWNLDLGTVDVHPVTADGWWGDCTRSFQRGANPAQVAALDAVRRIHDVLLDAAQPGMRACDWYAVFRRELDTTPYVPLDRLSNIGHSLTADSAYDDGYIDPWNQTVMRGAWAVEPFIGNHLYGTKREDVVWFGEHSCTVVA